MTLEKGALIPDLKVEKIVHKGLGLGHYNGTPVFVHQGLPGDDVAARVIHKRGDVYFAEIFSYNTRSKNQIPVSCEAFKECGGCDWLHVAYEDQLRFKQEIINGFFSGLCSDKKIINKIHPSPDVFFYRNKIFLPVTSSGKDLIAGMYARRSHKVIPHKQCYLQPENSDRIIEVCLELLARANVPAYDEKRKKGTIRYIGLRYSRAEDKFLVIFVTNSRKLPFSKIICDKLLSNFSNISGIVQNINPGQTNTILGEESRILAGSEYLNEKVGSITYRTHYSSFFQVNPSQTEDVFEFIREQVNPQDIVIDAYSGIGAIGLYIAGSVKKVVFLEQQAQAVQDAKENCRINALSTCRFVHCKVEEELDAVLDKTGAGTIIFDPPRKGLDREIIKIVGTRKINKVIYISCDIATQRRDVELLRESGFRIEIIQPFDMFPHTYHIENLVVLNR